MAQKKTEQLLLMIFAKVKTGYKQGRIHGKTVADGWAGAIMKKSLAIQNYLLPTDVPTYRPTRQGVDCRVACP